MPTWGGTYENPFYHNVRGNVKGELNARAKHYGTRIRAGKTNASLEWSYGKTAYGHVKGATGVTLGFPGAKVMSDMSGNIKLYNSRNVPKFPLLQSIDVTNDVLLVLYCVVNLYLHIFQNLVLADLICLV